MSAGVSHVPRSAAALKVATITLTFGANCRPFSPSSASLHISFFPPPTLCERWSGVGRV